ncbi:MAG: TonB-dependent receptor [Pseudomonadales bacterium]|nr:TonB-dependent receptor [Pseudomonadales bacterium]
MFEMPAGMVGSAFGVEYRKQNIDDDIDSGRNQCDWHEGGCGLDWTGVQDVYSGFFELRVPIIEHMEAQIAGRYTDYSGKVGSSFDPKVAILWQPMDWLSVRGSYSTAFIAPTLTQQFGSEACGLQTVQDSLTNDNSGTFRVGCVNSNPDLIPESADVWNIGASFSLLDGDLNLGIDYAEYKFKDRIARETVNNVLRADYQAFLAAGFSADPATGDADMDGVSDDAEAWIASSASDPDIFRDSSGLVTRVRTHWVNAQSMLNRSLDLYGRYNLSLNNWGDLTFNLALTQALEYSYDLGTPDPNDSGDGVGFQNEQIVEIPPMPEFRINGGVNWFLGNHAAGIRFRWIDSITLQFNSSALLAAQKAINGTDQLDAILYTDLNYKYTFPSLLGQRETTIEVGANNVFDELPDPIFNLGGAETYLHDLRGRMVYVRLQQDL